MKIDNKTLTELYQMYISEKKRFFHDECLSPEELIRFLRSEKTKNKSEVIINHVTSCSQCFFDFNFILEFLRKEKILNEEIKNLIKSNKTKKQRLFLNKYFFRNPFHPKLLLNHSILTIVILSTIILLFTLKIDFHNGRKYRGTLQNNIKQIFPINNKNIKAQLNFKWTKLNGTKYYTIEIFNESFYPIWKSNKIFTTEFSPPNEIYYFLENKKIYYWLVTAYFDNQEIVESSLESFIFCSDIKNPKV